MSIPTRTSKICPECGREFAKPQGWSASAWRAVTRCSQDCRAKFIRGQVYKSMLDRITEKVTYEPNSGCWLWTGGLSSYGYGATQFQGRQLLMHRVVFEMYNGAVPGTGVLCHRCNVRSCVNPDHIYIGTAQSNVMDAVRSGRHAHGTTHGCSKLSDCKVRQMRELSATGMTYADIAKRFGVARPTAAKACKGMSWQHVK